MSHTVTPAAVWHLGAVYPQEPPMSSATSSRCRDRLAATTWSPSTTFISWATTGGAILAHRERPRLDGADAKRERLRRTLNSFSFFWDPMTLG